MVSSAAQAPFCPGATPRSIRRLLSLVSSAHFLPQWGWPHLSLLTQTAGDPPCPLKDALSSLLETLSFSDSPDLI